MKRSLTNKLRALASNKKGSEVVEKIFMIIVSIAVAVAASAYITSVVKAAMDKGNSSTAVDGTASVTDPLKQTA